MPSASIPVMTAKPCLAVDGPAILAHAEELAAAGKRGVDLPVSIEATFLLLVVALAQCDQGIVGTVGDIGAVYRHGILSVRTMSLMRRANETFFSCGPFGGEDEDGFDLPYFIRPLCGNTDGESLCVGQHRRLRRLYTEPWGLSEADLLRYSGRGAPGFRALRLDRTRGANETARLLRVAACSLVEGGVLIVQGLQGMNDRPGVQEGFHRFMLDHEAGEKPAPDLLRATRRVRLVPFLWSGKRGGMFLASEEYASIYRRSLQVALPDKFLHTKFLYGSKMLVTVMWDAGLSHIKNVLLRAGLLVI